MEADDLSKKALGIGTGMICGEEFMGDIPLNSGTLVLQ